MSERQNQTCFQIVGGSHGAVGKSFFHGDECVQVQVCISLNHLRQSHFQLTLLRLVNPDVVQIKLRLVADLTHGLRCLSWELTRRSLLRQYHTIKSV